MRAFQKQTKPDICLDVYAIDESDQADKMMRFTRAERTNIVLTDLGFGKLVEAIGTLKTEHLPKDLWTSDMNSQVQRVTRGLHAMVYFRRFWTLQELERPITSCSQTLPNPSSYLAYILRASLFVAGSAFTVYKLLTPDVPLDYSKHKEVALAYLLMLSKLGIIEKSGSFRPSWLPGGFWPGSNRCHCFENAHSAGAGVIEWFNRVGIANKALDEIREVVRGVPDVESVLERRKDWVQPGNLIKLSGQPVKIFLEKSSVETPEMLLVPRIRVSGQLLQVWFPHWWDVSSLEVEERRFEDQPAVENAGATLWWDCYMAMRGLQCSSGRRLLESKEIDIETLYWSPQIGKVVVGPENAQGLKALIDVNSKEGESAYEYCLGPNLEDAAAAFCATNKPRNTVRNILLVGISQSGKSTFLQKLHEYNGQSAKIKRGMVIELALQSAIITPSP
ncbi:hypothetical protein BJ742DRAFT_858880 [Cladochytrium replicatum]|nr:hypothetical protein BJ742DRAFT_858880 [Cladochytrium replicatum]